MILTTEKFDKIQEYLTEFETKLKSSLTSINIRINRVNNVPEHSNLVNELKALKDYVNSAYQAASILEDFECL